MSSITGVEIRNQIITTEEDLVEFCAFDADLNGDNGDEYTMPEALETGFKTSAEYIVATAKEETAGQSFPELISNALEAVCRTDQGYLNYDVVDLQDGRYLGIIVVEKIC